MDFMENVPRHLRSEVEELITSDALDFTDKFTYLKGIIDDPEVMMLILDFMKKGNVSNESAEPPSSNDFLDMVTEQKRNVMNRMIEKELWDMLEKMVNKEQDEVQQAYKKWREWEQSGKAKKVKKEEPLKPKPRISQTAPSSNRTSHLDSSFRSSGRGSRRVRPLTPSESESDQDDESAGTEDDEEEEKTTAPEIDDSFFDSFPDFLNILILGETGVGKSTFINGLINYLKYGSIEEAHKNKVEILIDTYFTHTDEDYNRMDIRCRPTIEMERAGEAPNENVVYGQSSTQAAKSYVFSWGPKGSKKAIRIIDTPGVGDVRGVDQEKINFSNILNFIADFSELHAICILMKPNEARINLTFRYCINELLTHLHVSASRNILFCFTNARQTLYRPGDTLPTLEAHLKELNKKRGINIPLDSNTMFCFDNESFRFLCALREGAKFEKKDIENFNGSWVKTVEETFRMFKRISQLPAHNVNETLSVNNIRAVILALARPLAEIARNQLLNVKLIEDKIREVNDYQKNGKDLEGRLYVNQVKIIAKEINYPMTVCTAKGCVDHQSFDPTDPNAPMQTVYKTECHDHCYLQGVQVSLCPNPALQHCWALHANINQCRTCKCPWTTHMHIRYKLEKTMEKTMDPTVQESIKNKDDQVKTAQIFIDKETKRKEELQEEADKISQSCVEFAAFLRKNSILPYNDVYKEYVEHLIKEEKDKTALGGSGEILKKLEQYRDEYEQQVKILESHGTSSNSNKTIKQIYNMVDDLKRMQNCGSVLKEIQKLEMLSVRTQQITKVTPVDLNTGWLGQVTGGAKTVKNTLTRTWNYATGKGNSTASKGKKGGKRK